MCCGRMCTAQVSSQRDPCKIIPPLKFRYGDKTMSHADRTAPLSLPSARSPHWAVLAVMAFLLRQTWRTAGGALCWATQLVVVAPIRLVASWLHGSGRIALLAAVLLSLIPSLVPSLPSLSPTPPLQITAAPAAEAAGQVFTVTTIAD